MPCHAIPYYTRPSETRNHDGTDGNEEDMESECDQVAAKQHETGRATEAGPSIPMAPLHQGVDDVSTLFEKKGKERKWLMLVSLCYLDVKLETPTSRIRRYSTGVDVAVDGDMEETGDR